MDKKSLEVLDFGKLKEKLCTYARTHSSKELCQELFPCDSFEDITGVLEETDEALRFLNTKGDLPIRENKDIVAYVQKSAMASMLTGKELLEVTKYLHSLEGVTSLFSGTEENFQELWKYIKLIPNTEEIVKTIEDVIELDGNVKSDASPELKKIRKQISQTLKKIETTYEKLLNSTTYGKMFQDDILTKIDSRYVILLKTQYRTQFPCKVIGRSDSGESLYVEHMDVISLNNDYHMFQQLEKKEIERILMDLTIELKGKSTGILRGIEQINHIEFILCRAKLSRSWNGFKPKLIEQPILNVKEARHPLIPENEVIPISFSLGNDFRSMIITGPNTGGKTVTLKTAGLFVALTYSGLLIPATDKSVIGLYTDVLADIGEEQSIEQSLSSFSAHLTRIIEILSKVNQTTLVLLDELGSGTDPEEGAALGMALINELHREKVPLMVTTHLPLIKSFAYEYENVTNASVGFDLSSLTPTYRLYIGSPGESQAFEIAQKLGLEKEMITVAEKYINNKTRYTKNLMNSIHRTKEEIDDTLQETKVMKAKIEEQKSYYENEIQKIETKYRMKYEQDREKFNNRMTQYMEQAKETLSELSRQQRHSREAESLVEKMSLIGKNVKENKVPIADISQSDTETDSESQDWVTTPVERARDVEVGDFVFIPAISKEALVVKKIPRQKKVEVQYGQWRQTLPYKDIELIAKDEEMQTHVDVNLDQLTTFSPDLSERFDLHGFHIEDALPILDKFLDKAYMAKLPQVYIVHGAGTGVMRDAVTDFLKKHPHVKSIKPGEKTTVAYLR
ncbi:MAG: Smr/MutS family protein [Caldisericia bacterium]|nr:Smr/MutS family protein [Caldisericia bacterium]